VTSPAPQDLRPRPSADGDVPVTRRWAWRSVAAAGSAAVVGAVALGPGDAQAATSLDSRVAGLVGGRSRTARALGALVERRFSTLESRLLSTVLPAAVAAGGPLRAQLDKRYLRAGSGSGGTVVLTQAAYDALATPDPATLYVIVD
jgi:hypothetical protein